MKIVLSSGHGKLVRGASGYLDEVDEARKVVARVAEILTKSGVDVITFNDDVSHSQDENLNRIVDFHNSKKRDLDISVHFNAYQTTGKPMGTECLYVTQDALAQKVASKVAAAGGLINRGPKKRTDLFFLNKTAMPSILIEVCFVDSQSDVSLYDTHFDQICAAISEAVSGKTQPIEKPPSTGDEVLEKLLVIPPVTIYQALDASHISFISDLDVCNDGSGPAHGDPYHQSETAYYNSGKFLNADEDKYIVIPPQIRSMVPAKVMGCQARITNLTTGTWWAAVCGEIGPDDKTGEAAYCLAKLTNPDITHNCGDENRIYMYEIWPGIPALVDGKTYKLE